MKFSKLFVLACISLAGIFISSSSVQAQFQPDVRIGLADNGAHFLIGGGFRAPISTPIYINPTLNYIFIGKSGLFLIDVDGHYDFTGVTSFHFYAGPGVGTYVGEGSTAARLNLMAGFGLKGYSFEPYFQPKFVIGGGESFLQMTFGARF